MGTINAQAHMHNEIHNLLSKIVNEWLKRIHVDLLIMLSIVKVDIGD